MKVLVSCILSLAVLLTSFQHSLILVDYELNRDLYEANCINKDKPILECHGKCQIKGEAEKKLPETRFAKIGLDFNILPQKLISLNEPEIIAIWNHKPRFANYSENLSTGYYSSLLNPPQANS